MHSKLLGIINVATVLAPTKICHLYTPLKFYEQIIRNFSLVIALEVWKSGSGTAGVR